MSTLYSYEYLDNLIRQKHIGLEADIVQNSCVSRDNNINSKGEMEWTLASIKIINVRLGPFLFSLLFYFILDLELGLQYNVTITITTVTQSCDTEKVMEGSRTNNIMQHGNSILVLQVGQLQCVYRLQFVIYKIEQFVLRALLSFLIITQSKVLFLF